MPLQKPEIAAIVEQFYFGENDGARLIHALVDFAPGEHEKTFCRYWEQDEQKHDRLFSSILHEYDINPKGFNPLFQGLFTIAWKCVEERDWVKCMTISAVIENIALRAGEYLCENGDEPVKRVLSEILPDEKKHLGFSQQQLEIYAKEEQNKKKIRKVLRKVKALSFHIGKKNLFTKHDSAVADRAEQKLHAQLEGIGIKEMYVKNKNGYLRNLVFEMLL